MKTFLGFAFAVVALVQLTGCCCLPCGVPDPSAPFAAPTARSGGEMQAVVEHVNDAAAQNVKY